MSLKLSAVSHRYGQGPPVLTDLDFEVEADETVAIVGPSGSGKTTLLSIIGGLLRPSQGEVTLDGCRVGGQALPPGSVSWVFQTINLFARRTTLDNVAIGAHAVGIEPPAAKASARAILSQVGLAGFERHLGMQLSGGQAQRAGIARALVGRPRYLLADEPTGQLDRSTAALIAEVFFSARPTGTTVVAATHDPLIADACQHRYSIIDGRLRHEG